jgi:hypothetical protein
MAGLSVRYLLGVSATRGNEPPVVSSKKMRGSRLGCDDRRQQESRGRRSLILTAGLGQRRNAGTRATPSAGAFPQGRIRDG